MSVVDIRTLPWSWYTDPAVLQLERERIFRRSWQYVGHTGDVPEPGSFAATWVARRSGRPRPRQGGHAPGLPQRLPPPRLARLRGLRTTRDAPVPVPRLDVWPRRAPHHRAAREQGGWDRHEGARPRPAALSRHGGRCSSSTRTRTPSRSPTSSTASRSSIADAGIDLDALRFLQRSESELDCNWKISAENFLECYHCPTAHPGFSAVMDVNPDAYLLETSAGRMTQHGPPRREPRGAYDPTGEVERGQFHLLFPGTVVNVMPGRPNFSIGPMVPRDPGADVPLPRLLRRRGRRRGLDRGVARVRCTGRRGGSRARRARAGRRAGRARRARSASSRSPRSSSRTSSRSWSTHSRRRGRTSPPKYLQLVNVPRACGSA